MDIKSMRRLHIHATVGSQSAACFSSVRTCRRATILLLLYISIFTICMQGVVRAEPRSTVDERHSYSLSTFSPDGRLEQVERAQRATDIQGSNTVATALVVTYSAVAVATLQRQRLQDSLFLVSDGTPRFTQLTSRIVIAYGGGLSADARVVVAAAQQMAVQHEYTFDEEIDLPTLLQELSLLMQEYTIKPGTRPFGCSLIIAYSPMQQSHHRHHHHDRPEILRLDPSGAVTSLGHEYAVVAGSADINRDVRAKLKELTKSSTDDNGSNLIDTIAKLLKDTAENTISSMPGYTTADDNDNKLRYSTLTGLLAKNNVFTLSKRN